ncbi:MAG: queuosine 5'-phosphate N-glycosylase/hydrolase [Planctomycetota bacterium]
MSGLLDGVRAACGEVARRARFVRVAEERVPAYAASLPLERIRRPEHDPAAHYLGHGADTVAFFLTLDAVNFGSGYFPHLRKRPGRSGYFTIASCLADRFRADGPLSAKALATITPQACTRTFGQDPGNEPIAELMGLFARALTDLGRLLLDRYGGSFTTLVEAAGGSAERLVERLTAMPLFRDVSDYEGLRVPFYKRAQLAAADLAVAFGGEGWGRFEDLDRLTIFADNLVPHVLRHDGVLAYDGGLAARIDAGERLPAGSAEEVEIRACAVHAVERMVASLSAAAREVTAMGLDYLLWTRGQAPAYKADKPRHRTRTVFY